ncbi:DEAD-box ATP-dependent RNA helicase 37-like protein [Tanacetum coccineum]
MHNNIMAAGSRDRPPMLATGRHPQWQSRFLRYIDTRPNGDALRKCILKDLQGNDLLTGNRGSDLYIISLQETTSSTLICLMAKASPTQAWLWHRRLSHLNFDYINLLSKKDVHIDLPNQICQGSTNYLLVKPRSPTRKKASDYDNSGPVPQLQNVSPSADTTVPSQQELDLLFSPLYDDFFNACTSSVNNSSSPIDNSKQQDTPPTTNNPSSTEPSIPTNVNAEENNDNQAEDTQFQQDKFFNPFCTPIEAMQEELHQFEESTPGTTLTTLDKNVIKIASQVGVSHDLTKPVTPHSWPQVRKSSFAKPYNVNALGISRNIPKHVSFQSTKEFVGLNDMVHNYYLEEAKKKAQLQKDKALNTKPSVQQSARLPNTANGNKPKPRNFNQQPRNWPPSMSSRVSNRTVNTAEPPRNQKSFLKSKDLACPTCKKCIYSANHDECILKYLLKTDPYRTMFSLNKYYQWYLKTTPPRSGLTWKLTGYNLYQVGLKWIPIIKSVETRYNTNDSASPLGKETHNPKTVICANSSSLSAVGNPVKEVLLKLNLPDHRYKRRWCSLIPAELESLPHAHTQPTKTYYKHQDSRIKKAQELNTKTSTNSDIQDNSSEIKHSGKIIRKLSRRCKV